MAFLSENPCFAIIEPLSAPAIINHNPQVVYPDCKFFEIIPWFRLHYVFRVSSAIQAPKTNSQYSVG